VGEITFGWGVMRYLLVIGGAVLLGLVFRRIGGFAKRRLTGSMDDSRR